MKRPRARARRLVPGFLALALAVAIGAGACGGSANASTKTAKAVPTSIVPATMDIGGGPNGQFTLAEYGDAKSQFAHAGARSLVADGRLWEVRQGPTLVGTLQVSTLKPTVHVAKWKHRTQLAGLILPGAYTTITVSKVDVYATHDDQLTTYLWFGDQMFEVLQLKARGFQPEAVLRATLDQQIPTHALTIPGYEAKRPKNT